MLDRMRDPQARVRAAWGMFWICVVLWPITSLTIFASEPQGVLGLSWVALILNALNIVITTDVRREQENGG